MAVSLLENRLQGECLSKLTNEPAIYSETQLHQLNNASLIILVYIVVFLEQKLFVFLLVQRRCPPPPGAKIKVFIKCCFLSRHSSKSVSTIKIIVEFV